MTHLGMTLADEMEWLEGDLRHLVDIQNRQFSDIDSTGFPIDDQLSCQIGKLERIWGVLHDKRHTTS